MYVALEKEFYTHEETLAPILPAKKFDVVKHTDVKGIQGYQNSCYLDSTLYGMFTFSDAFDILLLENTTTNAEELELQKRLKSDIIYPLRKYVSWIFTLMAMYVCDENGKNRLNGHKYWDMPFINTNFIEWEGGTVKTSLVYFTLADFWNLSNIFMSAWLVFKLPRQTDSWMINVTQLASVVGH